MWPISDPDAIFSHKPRKEPEMKKQKGRPVETAAAVEIDSGGLRQLFLDDFHRCLKKPTQKLLRLFHSYAQARRQANQMTREKKTKGAVHPKCVSRLTEAIHFGNDVHPSVASLRLLDAFRRNQWMLSVGITGGLPRNTHTFEYSSRDSARFPVIFIICDFSSTVERGSHWRRGPTKTYRIV
jgi:hypothetical protein